MSTRKRFTVKQLMKSSLLRKPQESWADKSSSLPDLADSSSSSSSPSTTTSAIPETSLKVAPFGNGLNSQKEGKPKSKQSFISRKWRSLSKPRNSDGGPGCNGGGGGGFLRSTTTYQNMYDKYPGSSSTTTSTSCSKVQGKKDGDDGTTFQRCNPEDGPSVDLDKHQFSSGRIGYVSPPERGSTSNNNKVVVLDHVDSPNDTSGGGTTSGSGAMFVSPASLTKSTTTTTTSSVECTLVTTLTQEVLCYDIAHGLPETGTDDSLRVYHDASEGGSTTSTTTGTSSFIPDDRPPARPPKPLELRGEPLPPRDAPCDVPDAGVPPQPLARRPTAPAVRTVQLNAYRESGAYECIEDDRPPVLSEFGLPRELRKLPQQPWYWGPLTQELAEEKLRGLPDGYFLVRDSSDERYLLSLSFNSNGRPVHTRFEYVGGHFSINDSQGYISVVDLIEEAVRESKMGIYSFMQNLNGTQTFPARLTNPVSRFTEMKSLQHLSRFVIRETFPRHYVADLPVPEKIRRYILENQY